mgnify:CR=1 FL=1
MKKKKRVNDNLKTVVVTMSILFFITLMGFYLFNLYINIDINNNDSQTQYSATKTSQTVAQANEESKQIADVVEEVSNSVVGISKLQDNGNSIFLTDGSIKLGLGTGIIVSEDGYIVTNEHVSGSKYSSCYVTLENGKEYQANVVWSDTDLDLSIIKINVKGLEYANLGDSDKIRPGEKVYAIGNPIGFEFQRTVTSGIISAVDRTIKIEEEDKTSYMEDLIQTDATINPGNSGGPLINPNGEVIGINSIKIDSAESIGFAIPINIVKPIIQSYKETGNFTEASIGIFSYDKNVIPYLDSRIEFENGIYVVEVIKNSPAEKVGIRTGDIITKIDGITLNKMSELRKYIYTKSPGDEVTLLVQRKGIISPVKIELGKK